MNKMQKTKYTDLLETEPSSNNIVDFAMFSYRSKMHRPITLFLERYEHAPYDMQKQTT